MNSLDGKTALEILMFLLDKTKSRLHYIWQQAVFFYRNNMIKTFDRLKIPKRFLKLPQPLSNSSKYSSITCAQKQIPAEQSKNKIKHLLKTTKNHPLIINIIGEHGMGKRGVAEFSINEICSFLNVFWMFDASDDTAFAEDIESLVTALGIHNIWMHLEQKNDRAKEFLRTSSNWAIIIHTIDKNTVAKKLHKILASPTSFKGKNTFIFLLSETQLTGILNNDRIETIDLNKEVIKICDFSKDGSTNEHGLEDIGKHGPQGNNPLMYRILLSCTEEYNIKVSDHLKKTTEKLININLCTGQRLEYKQYPNQYEIIVLGSIFEVMKNYNPMCAMILLFTSPLSEKIIHDFEIKSTLSLAYPSDTSSSTMINEEKVADWITKLHKLNLVQMFHENGQIHFEISTPVREAASLIPRLEMDVSEYPLPHYSLMQVIIVNLHSIKLGISKISEDPYMWNPSPATRSHIRTLSENLRKLTAIPSELDIDAELHDTFLKMKIINTSEKIEFLLGISKLLRKFGYFDLNIKILSAAEKIWDHEHGNIDHEMAPFFAHFSIALADFEEFGRASTLINKITNCLTCGENKEMNLRIADYFDIKGDITRKSIRAQKPVAYARGNKDLYDPTKSLAEANECHLTSERIRNGILEPGDSANAVHFRNLAENIIESFYYDPSLKTKELVETAKKYAKQSLKFSSPESKSSALNTLARCYEEEEKYMPAFNKLKDALLYDERINGPYHPATALTLKNLAFVAWKLFLTDVAMRNEYYRISEESFSRAIDILESFLDPYSRRILSLKNHRIKMQGDYVALSNS